MHHGIVSFFRYYLKNVFVSCLPTIFFFFLFLFIKCAKDRMLPHRPVVLGSQCEGNLMQSAVLVWGMLWKSRGFHTTQSTVERMRSRYSTWLVSPNSNLVLYACLWRLKKAALREYCKKVRSQNRMAAMCDVKMERSMLPYRWFFGYSCLKYCQGLVVQHVFPPD